MGYAHSLLQSTHAFLSLVCVSFIGCPRSRLCLQGAAVFNQPLSFNTSNVIYMVGMFGVRPVPSCQTSYSVARVAYLPHRSFTGSFIPAACFQTWQNALDFNQSLSFDTSSVRDMGWMFGVRSACLASCPLQLPTFPPSAHCLGFCPMLSCVPGQYLARTDKQYHLVVLILPFGSVGRVGVRSTAETRRIQRHIHGRNVSGALWPNL